MRPASVQWFERLLLTALIIDFANNLSAWNTSAASLAAKGIPPNPLLVLALSALSPTVGLILWYLVARKGSNIARWITTGLVILATIGFAAAAVRTGGDIATHPMFLVAAIAEALKLAAVSCLFAASAAAWFTRTAVSAYARGAD